jgi:hypothetical protein
VVHAVDKECRRAVHTASYAADETLAHTSDVFESCASAATKGFFALAPSVFPMLAEDPLSYIGRAIEELYPLFLAGA